MMSCFGISCIASNNQKDNSAKNGNAINKLTLMFNFFTSNLKMGSILDFSMIANLLVVNRVLNSQYQRIWTMLMRETISIPVQAYFPSNSNIVRLVSYAAQCSQETLTTIQLFNEQIFYHALELSVLEAINQKTTKVLRLLIDGPPVNTNGERISDTLQRARMKRAIQFARRKYLLACQSSQSLLHAQDCYDVLEALMPQADRHTRWAWKIYEKGKLIGAMQRAERREIEALEIQEEHREETAFLNALASV